MKPRAGNIDRFCSKLSQSDIKRLVKLPCEHKCITTHNYVTLSTGQGQDQVTKGHQNKTKLFRAWGTCFIATFARIIKKSKPFCNPTPCKSVTENGQVNLGSHKVKLLNWYFRIRNVCFWMSLFSGFQKCHFSLCARSRNAPNSSLKKCRHQRIRFSAIWLPTIDITTWNWACLKSRDGSATYIPFFLIFGIFWILTSVL